MSTLAPPTPDEPDDFLAQSLRKLYQPEWQGTQDQWADEMNSLYPEFQKLDKGGLL